jgi:hypothetical protein
MYNDRPHDCCFERLHDHDRRLRDDAPGSGDDPVNFDHGESRYPRHEH